MVAYLLLILAVLSRLLPHAGWFNFTAVGGALLFFGARRPLRESLLPLAAFIALDGYLTVVRYGYGFHVAEYLPTWAWYFGAILLGSALLKKPTVLRGIVAILAGPTSFFLISNGAVWIWGTFYAKNFSGLLTCYAAGLPFYKNDLLSTALFIAVAFGLPALVARIREHKTPAYAAIKNVRR
jgi:hypothetical protein